MESNNTISYDVSKSAERIDSILDAKNENYEEIETIPERSKLTFTNGYYVKKVGAIFADIRQSSELTDEHKRPKLAKLYRSYISETVAILNSYTACKEINIVGDCVSGIFDAQYKSQVEDMVSAAGKINTLIKILNYKYKKKEITEIAVGIGIAWGRVLMIKAGYSGSGINDVIWMGDVVNEASNLCGEANKFFSQPIMIDSDVYANLSDESKKLFTLKNSNCYQGNYVNTVMNKWYEDNCK